MTETPQTGLATEDQEWVTFDGDDIELGAFVRVTATVTGEPTAYPSLYPVEGMRPIDFGRVYELLDNGNVKVQWNSADDDAEPVEEKPENLELSTEEMAAAFQLGFDQAYEVGYRDGGMVQMNATRVALGLPMLTVEQYGTVVCGE